MSLTGMHRFFARSLRCMGIVGCVAAFLGMTLVVAPASAETVLADFVAQPTSPGMYEMIWNNGELYEGPGAVGTGFMKPGPGDGEDPIGSQKAPGLLVQSPFNVPGIEGSIVMLGGPSPATAFYDATLDISPLNGNSNYGMPGVGDAVVTTVGGTSIVTQALGSAMFEIWSTDPIDSVGDIENPKLLLTGTIDDASIVGILGSTTGAVLSAHVAYTDGLILDAAGLGTVHGELSWSLLNLTQPFAIDATTNQLVPFEANATGQFKYVSTPEPGTLALLWLGALTIIGYTPRKRRP